MLLLMTAPPPAVPETIVPFISEQPQSRCSTSKSSEPSECWQIFWENITFIDQVAELSCQLGEHVTSSPPKGAKSVVGFQIKFNKGRNQKKTWEKFPRCETLPRVGILLLKKT